jgi:hypothetical protein
MKKSVLVCVMLAALGISAQAYGYVLVYNVFGMVQAVDTADNSRDLKTVNGFIVLNVNETDGTVDESSVVLYGREGWRNRIFTVTDDAVVLTPYGNSIVLMVDTGMGNEIIMTGRARNTNIGLAGRTSAAPTLEGGMSLVGGQLFDLNEWLVGAGAMQAMLNNWLTRNANQTAITVDEAVDSILTNLESRGFVQLVDEVEPPLPG